MLPTDIRVAAEVEEHAVRLRKVNELLRFRVAECELAARPERDAHCAVLVLRAHRVEGGRVVVERLPVGAVAIPIESRSAVALGDREVLAHLIQNLVVSGRALRVLAQQMRALVPRQPLSLPVAPRLTRPHFLDEFVVDVPTVFLAEKIRHDDHVIVLDRLGVAGRCGRRDDAHGRTDELGGRVERGNVILRLLACVPMREAASIAVRAPAELEIAAWPWLLWRLPRRQNGFLDGSSAAALQGERNVALSILQARAQRAIAVFPPMRDVAADEEKLAVGLREVDRILGVRAPARQLARLTECVEHGAVVVRRAAGLPRGELEGMLLGATAHPRDRKDDAFPIDGKVSANLLHDGLAPGCLAKVVALPLLEAVQLFGHMPVVVVAVPEEEGDRDDVVGSQR
mmetsp:Transcript_113883/g.322104  ORF Transcript_113883/g.322104 Transcript_113883/m.322104 type:complete len:400 (+) Transcript_113883:387-1586(+)